MNNKFKEIGIMSEDELINFIDRLGEEEEIKSSLYGFFSDRCAFSDSGEPAYVIMTKYKNRYCVWITEEYGENYCGEIPYNLCDIFSSYKDADLYFKSLEHSGIKPGNEQIINCKNEIVDSGNVRIEVCLTIFDRIHFRVFYRDCLIIEHMMSLDSAYINNAISMFKNLCREQKVFLSKIYKKQQRNSFQCYYFIEYIDQDNESHTIDIHIPSRLQGQKRCVFNLLKGNEFV